MVFRAERKTTTTSNAITDLLHAMVTTAFFPSPDPGLHEAYDYIHNIGHFHRTALRFVVALVVPKGRLSLAVPKAVLR